MTNPFQMSDTSITSPESFSHKETDPAPVQYLLFTLAGNKYGVPINQLQEVLRFNPDALAPVPNTADWLEGIISLRGAITSVINLKIYFKLEAEYSSNRSSADFVMGSAVPRLLVVYANNLSIALLVEDINGILFVQPELILSVTQVIKDSYGKIGDFLSGFYTEQETDTAIALINAQNLIITPALQQVSAAT
ncbi:chemotaxis protein CheW [Candidatus Chlorohelix sp.]|uniref:chemotaxis protein CheW n=1 Tax=Candidatus Chlorohelix sp. TaxID=3139201 RepID=UPI0030295CC4